MSQYAREMLREMRKRITARQFPFHDLDPDTVTVQMVLPDRSPVHDSMWPDCCRPFPHRHDLGVIAERDAGT